MARHLVLEINGPDTMKPMLDGLMAAVRALGYQTHEWLRRDPLPYCDVLVVWGWNMEPRVAASLAACPARRIYIEKGWFADRDSVLQVDAAGTNARASWAGEPLAYTPAGPPATRAHGCLLVCLRYENGGNELDNITPWFANNMRWLEHIARAPAAMPILVRPHFATGACFNHAPRGFTHARGWHWLDGSEQCGHLLPGVAAVACIDSTVGSKALELGVPVLCYGEPVYRKPGAVYCLTNDPAGTAAALRELDLGTCSLDRGAVAAMVAKMKGREWRPEQAPTFADRLRNEFDL